MTQQTPSTRRVSRRGLVYGLDGDGPVVVLVHGFCLSRRIWMYLEHGLVSSGHRVITPDLAGYGDSGALSPRLTLEEHAEDITDLLEEMSVDQAVLVGFAFGAGVILSCRDYSRVGGLVSLAVPSAATAPYARMRGALLKDWPRFAARSADAILSQPASPETKAWLARIFESTSIKSALAGLDILEALEPTQLIKRWVVPALFVHGADDPIVPSTVSKECAKAFDGDYSEVPSSGHLVVLDQREATLAAVQGAVARSLPGE